MRWLALSVVVLLGPCSKRAPDRGALDAGGPDAAASVGAIADAAPAPAASGPSDADRQKLARAKKTLASIEGFVARGAPSDPSQPGEDASLACASMAEQRPALEKLADPEARTAIERSSKLCAFDVPLLVASDSLDQLARSRSQSSTLLFCGSAQREIAQARSVDPRDPRVRALERKWAARCRAR